MADAVTVDQQPNAGGDKTYENESDIQSVLENLDDDGQKVVKSLLHQKKHFREKADSEAGLRAKAEADLAAARNAPPAATTTPPATETPAATTATDDKTWRERMDFMVSHRDLSATDLEQLSAISKGTGVSLEKALESTLWAGYQLAEKAKTEQAATTPASRGTSEKFEKEEDFAKVTEADIPVMSSETFTKYQAWLKKQDGGR